MCGHQTFRVEDNVAHFEGYMLRECMPRVGVQTTEEMRAYASRLLVDWLRMHYGYEVGEGIINAVFYDDNLGMRVNATIAAVGADSGELPFPAWY